MENEHVGFGTLAQDHVILINRIGTDYDYQFGEPSTLLVSLLSGVVKLTMIPP